MSFHHSLASISTINFRSSVAQSVEHPYKGYHLEVNCTKWEKCRKEYDKKT